MKKIIEKEIEKLKENWLRIKGVEPSEKIVWYFRRGLEKHIELVKRHEPIIVAERIFDNDDVLLADDEHYPTRKEYQDCRRAFSFAFFTSIKVI
jgi:hypothetical protein